MATKRITVSVPTDVAERIKRAAGHSHSVSEWVTNAVTRTLEEQELRARFLAFCDGVKATPAETRQAKASFERITKGAKNARAIHRGKTAA